MFYMKNIIYLIANRWFAIQNSIQIAVSSDEAIRRWASKKLQSPILILMDYIPNISVTYMGPLKCKKAFEDNTRLLGLGQILSLDCFINNSDRYPLLWQNSGNPENLILELKTKKSNTVQEMRDPNNLTIEFGGFYAIDNRINLLDKRCKYAHPNMVRYFQSFEGLLERIGYYLRGNEGGISGVERLEEVKWEKKFELFEEIECFIKKFGFYELEGSSDGFIVVGMVFGFDNLRRLGLEGVKRIKNYLETSDFAKDDNWKDGLVSIHIDFLESLLNYINVFTEKNKDIIEKLHKISEYKYHIDFYDNGVLNEERFNSLFVEKDFDQNSLVDYIEESSKFIMEQKEIRRKEHVAYDMRMRGLINKKVTEKTGRITNVFKTQGKQ